MIYNYCRKDISRRQSITCIYICCYSNSDGNSNDTALRYCKNNKITRYLLIKFSQFTFQHLTSNGLENKTYFFVIIFKIFLFLLYLLLLLLLLFLLQSKIVRYIPQIRKSREKQITLDLIA